MTDTEKALRMIYRRLGEIRDVLLEIRDGFIELDEDDAEDADDAQGDEPAPDAPEPPRAVK